MKKGRNTWLKGLHPGVTLCLLQAALVARCTSQAPFQADAQEYQLKASYLKMIPSFVEWPTSDKKSSSIEGLHICVIGQYSFGLLLAQEAAKSTARGKKMDAHWARKESELKGCQVVFVSRSEASHYAKILGPLKGSNALTVGETDGFLEAGGMVRLYYRSPSLQFDVNLNAARAAQLKVDARLLSLAKRVINEKEQAGI